MSTERDPNGLSANQPGAKLDAGKPDVTLLASFGRALREVARVGDYGQQKYSRNGWLSVPDGVRRYTRAMIDHWLKEESEGIYDQDQHPLMQSEQWRNKIRHDAQVAWNALARLELRLREVEAKCAPVFASKDATCAAQGDLAGSSIAGGLLAKGTPLFPELTTTDLLGGTPPARYQLLNSAASPQVAQVDRPLGLAAAVAPLGRPGPGAGYLAMTSAGLYLRQDGVLADHPESAEVFTSQVSARAALSAAGYTGRPVPA